MKKIFPALFIFITGAYFSYGLGAEPYILITECHNQPQTAELAATKHPAALTVMVATTGISCNGMLDGEATANANGGTAPYTYSWSTVPPQTTPTATGLSAGNYTVTVTDNSGATATASATITQPTPLIVNVNGPAFLCPGTNGTLTANVSGGTSPYQYVWNPGAISTTSTATVSPASTTTYTVTVTDNNGCSTTTEFTVSVGAALLASVSGNMSICSGLTTNLCANTTGGTGGNIYSWQPGGYSTPCITVSPASTITYTVTITDNCGTTTTAGATVNVNPLPIVNFTNNISQGCVPLCIQFFNTTTLPQGGPAQYVWSFGNGDSSHLKAPFYCYPNGGNYGITLTVTSDSGCSATLFKAGIIKVFSKPDAAFSISPQPATILDPIIQFTDQSADTLGIASRAWTFNDEPDTTIHIQNPVHTYQDTGSYCATLIVTDTKGCADTVTNCLVIGPVYTLYIPSAFSPNGDGLNDFFAPKGQDIKSFEMYIFDRWGMVVCHTTDINQGWNGTVQGGSKLAAEDIYLYKIQVMDAQYNVHNYVGRVTLVK